MIIGIVGSRRRNSSDDFKKVSELFDKLYQEGDSIVSGICPKGADHFALLLANAHKIPIKIYKPDWWGHGKGAGFMCNTDIAKNADVLIACVTDDRAGGVEDTIKKYIAFGKKELLLV